MQPRQPLDPLTSRLRADAQRARAAGLWRDVPEPASGAADFTSNDYLGLSRHPALIGAARTALERWGAGARAARLLGGGSPLERELERAAAAWLESEDCLSFCSGYHANVGLLGALVEERDEVYSDERNHASLIDGVRLCGAQKHVYRHVDVGDLERRLARRSGRGLAFVVTESVFSMDGDLAPLGEIAGLCARFGAHLVLDEAHAAGLLGPRGAGAWSALAPTLPDDVRAVLVARVVTAGKALGASGALVAANCAVRERLIQRARTFLFTTAAPPANAAAVLTSIALVAAADAERARALGLARRLSAALELPAPAAAIVPWVIGPADVALEHAERLRAAGLDVRAVRPPTVPDGSSRLRLVCHAFNTDGDLERLVRALEPARAVRATVRAPSAERTGPGSTVPGCTEPGASAVCVAGTDTNVGKSVVSALLVLAAERAGPCAYWKPVQCGRPGDSEVVAELTGLDRARVLAPAADLELAASPHEAAEAEGRTLEPQAIADTLVTQRRALGADSRLVVELAGGLLVPWRADALQVDWLAATRLATVLVARSGLGTLNHTLLSLEALRTRGIEPRALFLVGPPHASNARTLRALARVKTVFEVPRFEPLDRAALETWLDRHDLSACFEGSSP